MRSASRPCSRDTLRARSRTIRRAALLAALIVASSPIALLTGATLLNATLSLACSAVTLWALARLHRGADAGATWGLALATGINLHNRAFDQAALIAGAACILVVAHFREPLVIARRLLPAIALAVPFLVLMPLLNQATSGDWRHSGYWLYYQANSGIETMGFGRGMGGFDNSLPNALSKTIANAVRMTFYTSGGPWVFAPMALAAIAAKQGRGPLRAAGWMTLVYFGAYLVYTAAPIQTTGPIYFDALVPVLAAAAAVGAARVHDAIEDREALRRAVPAFAVAHVVAALAIFWPTAANELRAAAKDSGACDDVARRTLAPHERAIIFVTSGGTHRSWTYWKPMPSPTLDDRILFSNIDGPAADTALVEHYGPGRSVYTSRCIGEPHPTIERFDPKTGARSAL